MGFGAIAKLLAGVKRAANPLRSVDQQALIEAAGDYGHMGLPPSATEALATKYALDPYRQPQDRRTFFKNVIGAPARLRDIEQTKLLGSIDTATLADDFDGFEGLADVFGPDADLQRLLDLENMAHKAGRSLNLFEYDTHGDRWVYEGDPIKRVLEDALQVKEDPAAVEKALAPETEDTFLTPWLKRFRRG